MQYSGLSYAWHVGCRGCVCERHLLKSVLLGVMRLSLSEPGLGPLLAFGFSVTAAAARGRASEHPQRLLRLWRALLNLPAVREIAPLCKTYGDLHSLQLLT